MAAGLSQGSLARRAGVDQATLSLLETGRTEPMWTVLAKLIRCLGVDLVGGVRERAARPKSAGAGSLACRRCRRTITRGAAALGRYGPAYCLRCLARHPGATFGERLKAHRLAAGLTQQELADATGTYPQEISCYERDETEPTWRTVAALVRALGVGLVDVR